MAQRTTILWAISDEKPSKLSLYCLIVANCNFLSDHDNLNSHLTLTLAWNEKAPHDIRLFQGYLPWIHIAWEFLIYCAGKYFQFYLGFLWYGFFFDLITTVFVFHQVICCLCLSDSDLQTICLRICHIRIINTITLESCIIRVLSAEIVKIKQWHSLPL